MHNQAIPSVINLMVFGAIILALAYHLVIYFFQKNKLLFHYNLYLFTTFLYLFYISGFYINFFGESSFRFFYLYYNEPIQILYYASYFNFILQSINVTITPTPFLKRSWKLMMFVLIGYALLFFTYRLIYGLTTYYMAFNGIRIFIFISTFVTLWHCYKLRNITFQRYILIGSSVYFVFGLCSFSVDFFIPNNTFLRPTEFLAIGTFIDVVFFSIAMSYRTQMLINDYNKALIDDANQIIAMQKEVLANQTALENERNRVASDMHDDLGSGLTKIVYLSQANPSNETFPEHLNKIKKIASDLVENMGEIIWALKEENDSLEDLLGFIKKYAFEYFDENKIEMKINTSDYVPHIIMKGDDRRSIFMLIKEALHNIEKHAKANKVDIQIELKDELKICIQDNGIGFDATKTSHGNGLKNFKKRIEKLQGEMEISSQNGTIICFRIPLQMI